MNTSRILLAFKALRELGPRQLGFYALYQAGLRSGRFRCANTDHNLSFTTLQPVLDLPDPAAILETIGAEGLAQLTAEADEIAAGRARIFGGLPVPLEFTSPEHLHHWTAYETGKAVIPYPSALPVDDIKFLWEPARFTWAFTLGRAYHLTNDERYPAAFWHYFETFSKANPPNLGPNWMSAQEVALRLIAFTFAAQIFAPSPHSTAIRHSQIAISVAAHAARIPPTLIYARAQNNNHLLSEAAGLITASLALPDHPDSPRWEKLGWKWFNRGLESQISADGAYMQHSANYHRLMLQLALWVHNLKSAEYEVSKSTPRTPHPALDSATRWLLALTDPETGRVPNLGPNDGAYILPLTGQPFHDYRPVLQAAARTFLGEPAYAAGAWDEMSLWLCTNAKREARSRQNRSLHTAQRAFADRACPAVLRAPRSWGYLRTARFNDRPGHADQLHLDLWWRGLNIAQDAGTYLYNANPPWDNALTHTAVHNTVMVDNREQMTCAGRFLYLDWAQAEVIARERAAGGEWERIVARHNGYRRLGVIHQRSVTAHVDDHWVIEDRLGPSNPGNPASQHTARLHWLLPDWRYEIQSAARSIRIQSPQGWISIAISGQPLVNSVQLVRAGELLHGSGPVSPAWGWVSPTYNVKIPALSFAVTVTAALPIVFITKFTFPGPEQTRQPHSG